MNSLCNRKQYSP